MHYWIGKEASLDKLGSVCFRAVQLNNFIGGKAKHFREKQGEESELFLSYFKKHLSPHEDSQPMSGIIYLEGGTESSFKKVKQIQEFAVPRLYRFYLYHSNKPIEGKSHDSGDDAEEQIEDNQGKIKSHKGKKSNVQYFLQRVHTDPRYLNETDVFLLDTGGFFLCQWNGQLSKNYLQLQTHELASLINTFERKSKARLEILYQAQEDKEGRQSNFWNYLRKGEVLTRRICGNSEDILDTDRETQEKIDEEAKDHNNSTNQGTKVTEHFGENEYNRGMYEILIVRGESGSMDMQSIWKQSLEHPQKPSRKLLNSVDVFLCDCFSEIFIFHGKKSVSYTQQVRGEHINNEPRNMVN